LWEYGKKEVLDGQLLIEVAAATFEELEKIGTLSAFAPRVCCSF
jgi:hypothetical protein